MAKFDFKKRVQCVAQHCVASRLRKLNRVVTNLYNAELAALGMTASQFNILTALANLQPTSPAQIGGVLHLEKSSLSRNLKLMRRNGWIGSDGRARNLQVRISAKGEGLYARAFPCWERAQNQCHELLGLEMTENLHAATEALPTA